MLSIHQEIFDDRRESLFKKLSVFKKHGYLGGGTALALQVKHRKSYDFDIFTSKQISNELRIAIKNVLGDVSYIINSGDQLSFTSIENIAITFLWYPFKPLKPLIKTRSLSLASIIDIASDKAYTMGRRAQWRDYVDIYWILRKQQTSLEQICLSAKEKFGGAFSEVQLLEQLVYFSDVTITPIEYIDKSVSADTIKEYIIKAVSDYTRMKTR